MIIDLNVAGKQVIIVGGGTEGTRKVKSLLGQDCKITIISNRLNKYLKDQAKERKMELLKMTLTNANVLDRFRNPFLVLACTNSRELNRKLVQKAKALGAFAYAADDPAASDFIHPAVVNIDNTIFVTISTKGKSPAMARTLRIRVEKALKRLMTDMDVEYIKLASFARNAAMGTLKDTTSRKKYLYRIIKDKRIKSLMKSKKYEDAKSAAMEILEGWG